MSSQNVFTSRHALHKHPTLVDQKQQKQFEVSKTVFGFLWLSLQPNKHSFSFFAIIAETPIPCKSVELKFKRILTLLHEVKSDENHLAQTFRLLNSKLSCKPHANTNLPVVHLTICREISIVVGHGPRVHLGRPLKCVLMWLMTVSPKRAILPD